MTSTLLLYIKFVATSCCDSTVCGMSWDRIDASRKFVLTYYVQDGSVHIFEETIKNSGILGGHYVNRGHYLNKNPPEGGPGRPIRASDVFVGATLELSVGKKMKVLEMDASCISYCEGRPEIGRAHV